MMVLSWLPSTPGTATLFPEYLIYNLETDPDEKFQELKNASAPYNSVGVLEVGGRRGWVAAWVGARVRLEKGATYTLGLADEALECRYKRPGSSRASALSTNHSPHFHSTNLPPAVKGLTYSTLHPDPAAHTHAHPLTSCPLCPLLHTIQVTWAPCSEEGKPLEEEEAYVESEEDIVGKPWNGRIRIRYDRNGCGPEDGIPGGR